jgi:hypothetical protein
MAKFLQATGGHSFRAETEEVEVTQGPHPAPDPEWFYEDRNGHRHQWSAEDGYPTLRWVDDEPYWCEEHQELHDSGHYECAKCGEEIAPGTRLVGGHTREFAPGMKRFYIDDEEVDEETFKRQLAAAST